MSEVRESRPLRPLLVLLAPCLMSTCLYAQYGGGTGEPNDPYLIYTPAQMNAIGADPNHWDKHFKLMADIDLGEYTGTQYNVIGRQYKRYNSEWGYDEIVHTPFSGVFDGNDHTISNFTWSSGMRDCAGIFGCVDGPAAEIKNVHIIDPNVMTEEMAYVGSLIRYLGFGVVTNCSVRGGSISGGYRVGGLVGVAGGEGPWGLRHEDTTRTIITDCHANSTVAGTAFVGGLVGQNWGTITFSDARGSVTGQEDPATAQGNRTEDPNELPPAFYGGSIGGLVGLNDGTISDCHANSEVVGNSSIGGLAGWNQRTILRCHATGNTTGNFRVGGLVGTEVYSHSTITASYATGNTTGNYDVGGLVGWGRTIDTITGCYATGATTGLGQVGGLVGLLQVGAVANCHATGPVNAEGCAGGLVGESYYSTITNCYATQNIIAGGEFIGSHRGGLIGLANGGGTIANCYATADVNGTDCLGGLIGSNSANVTGSYSTGTVRGTQYVGGLVGLNEGEITDCYARGPVWGTEDIGGLAGVNKKTITNCYATGQTIWGKHTGGLIGNDLIDIYTRRTGTAVASFWDMQTTRQATSAGGTGKSTISMQSAHTFLYAGWDFIGETANGTEDIWWIEEGNDYPRLAWEREADSSGGDADAAAATSTGESP